MLHPPAGPQEEREWVRRQSRQHAVLLHLHENGAMNWSALYLHFDLGAAGEIGPVLHDIKTNTFIDCDTRNTVSITRLGKEYLKHGE